jgi:hypothetical protein
MTYSTKHFKKVLLARWNEEELEKEVKKYEEEKIYLENLRKEMKLITNILNPVVEEPIKKKKKRKLVIKKVEKKINTWRDFLDKLPTDIENIIMDKCLKKQARKNKRSVLSDIKSFNNSGWKDRMNKIDSNKYLTYRYLYTHETYIYNTATYLFMRGSPYCNKTIQSKWEDKWEIMDMTSVGDDDEDSDDDINYLDLTLPDKVE